MSWPSRRRRRPHKSRKSHLFQQDTRTFCGRFVVDNTTSLQITGDVTSATCAQCIRGWKEMHLARNPNRGPKPHKDIYAIEASTLAREELDGVFDNPYFGNVPLPYIGMTADYAGVDDAVFREAEERASFRLEVDCDDWTEELRLRGKEPDWSSQWVLQMNTDHGQW